MHNTPYTPTHNPTHNPPRTPARTLALLAALLAALTASTAALAQQDPPPAELEPTNARPPVFTVDLGARHYFDTDFDASAGELSTTRATLGVAGTFFLHERTTLTASLTATQSWYDFSNATTLHASGDPFEDATEIDLALRLAAPLNDNTSYFVLGSVGLAAESGADTGDAIVFGGGAGVLFQQSPTFQWGIGIAVRSRLEDDALVIPLPQIRWAISDRWTLATEQGGLALSYKASDALNYGLSAAFDSRTFRLDDAGPIPDGVATEQRVPLAFFARYKPDDTITLTAHAGASVYNNIELFDSVGNELNDEDTDPAVFIGLSASFRF